MTVQPSLFDVGAVRASDPPTSHEAAARIDTSSQKAAILKWLAARGELSRDLLAHLTHIRSDVVSTRIASLRHAGLVKDTGRTATGDSGMAQTLWTLTPDGRYFVDWKLK